MTAPYLSINDIRRNDERYFALDSAMEHFDYKQDTLLEVLTVAQKTFGYISHETVNYIADLLKVPASKVYGVATFYDLFTLNPVGDKRILVCTDPACSIAGAHQIVNEAKERINSQENSNNTYTIEPFACLGLCDQAPAALVNDTAQVEISLDDIDALIQGSANFSRIQISGNPRVMTRLIGEIAPTDLNAHLSAGTFNALKKAVEETSPLEIIEEVKNSRLVGRGGAGFPTGLKWEFTRTAPGKTKLVVCNFDESEPGTFKDRVLIEGDPFRVIEGLMISAYAIGAEHGYIFVRGEYQTAYNILMDAREKLFKANLLGNDIMDSNFNFDFEIRQGAGAYICGEETALFEAIEGKRGHPRSKPPYPTTHGLFGKPTSINNVETLANVPDIILNGSDWYRQWGTEESVGIKLFCLSGHVNKPGVVEVPFGISIRQIVDKFGGGFRGEPQAILIGGAAGGFINPENLDTQLTNEALKQYGVPIGSGVIMVFNTTVDMWKIIEDLAHFFMHESCGKCTPCRIGTKQIYNLLNKVNNNQGTRKDINKIINLGDTMRTTSICGLGMTAANHAISFINNFEHNLNSI
jgi:NADH-quinone oxidoreductase subunit F